MRFQDQINNVNLKDVFAWYRDFSSLSQMLAAPFYSETYEKLRSEGIPVRTADSFPKEEVRKAAAAVVLDSVFSALESPAHSADMEAIKSCRFRDLSTKVGDFTAKVGIDTSSFAADSLINLGIAVQSILKVGGRDAFITAQKDTATPVRFPSLDYS